MLIRQTLRALLLTTLATTPLLVVRLQAQPQAQSVAQTPEKADGMEAHNHAPSTPSTRLVVTPPSGEALLLGKSAIGLMPHKTITVLNEHTKQNETYSGVPLEFLLAQIGVPTGKDLKGKAYLMYVIAEGTDHYRVLYSLDEVDSVAHLGDVLVADTLNGAPLTTDGAFKLVSSQDKRPARWVRNLTSLTVKSAE